LEEKGGALTIIAYRLKEDQNGNNIARGDVQGLGKRRKTGQKNKKKPALQKPDDQNAGPFGMLQRENWNRRQSRAQKGGHGKVSGEKNARRHILCRKRNQDQAGFQQKGFQSRNNAEEKGAR